ncbi:MAG: cupredoxin domain-containing protein [Actinomycetota bacterium]|nr:cupredoxin domain-containing protein [Actinomycetota bacterium]
MRRLLAALFALSVLLVGCGSDDPTSSGSDAGSDAGGAQTGASGGAPSGEDSGGDEVAGTITIADFAYGEPLTVAPEALIRVVNEDSAQHDVDATDGTSFNTDLLGQGEELTFNAPAEEGTYEFFCSNHPDMSGELIVAA